MFVVMWYLQHMSDEENAAKISVFTMINGGVCDQKTPFQIVMCCSLDGQW